MVSGHRLGGTRGDPERENPHSSIAYGMLLTSRNMVENIVGVGAAVPCKLDKLSLIGNQYDASAFEEYIAFLEIDEVFCQHTTWRGWRVLS